ncbi:MAG: thioredoxin domain-containing protein, partial [Deltaproteobacteria bacterium]|nr:thioredoxin domain-containing protein [Deltaproteobacteria bacterium]
MKEQNRLAESKNPYLLQHADNPVRWHPWDDEALARAKAEDKAIFLSVGYSTCHWCHVMERESFEDESTAALLDEYFISIKVDREERPDLDRVYMSYVQAVAGSGGWPMSVWLTPDLQPFYGGTYFPPEDRYGRPGFRTLLREIGEAWRNERPRVLETAKGAVSALQQISAPSAAGDVPAALLLDSAYESFSSAFDATYGGFGNAPKFPRPVTLNFLLRHYERKAEPQALEMVRESLEAMARGGIYDHLGGGFHRYSVDRQWHLPHFEKMLYDQAQLLKSHVELHQISGDAAHAEVAHGIARYVLRDLRDEALGGFYSAEDADSLAPDDHQQEQAPQKREGAFYVWTHKELVELLGEDSKVFCEHFQCSPEGNAEDPHGELVRKNILHARGPAGEAAARL